MPYITPKMVSCAEFDVSNAHQAGIIKAMGGMGGCKTMEQAPPEVAKWFDREASVAEVIFSAMDHECVYPYGLHPSLDMIAAGNQVLSWLMNAKFAEPVVREDAKLMSEVPLHLQPYMFSTESSCAHVYRKMREVGGLISFSTPTETDLMADLAERNRQIEIVEKGGNVRCYRNEYRPERRRLYRIKIATQKASLATVSPDSQASMYDFEVKQLSDWLQARAVAQRTAYIAEELDEADSTLSRITEALTVPSIAFSLERDKAHAIWNSIGLLKEQLIKAGFPEPL